MYLVVTVVDVLRSAGSIKRSALGFVAAAECTYGNVAAVTLVELAF